VFQPRVEKPSALIKTFFRLFLAASTFVYFGVFVTVGAYAEQTISIYQGQPMRAMQSSIQAAIDIVGAGGTGIVIVKGSNTSAEGGIRLTIPNGITLVWSAELVVSKIPNTGPSTGLEVLTLEGSGSLELTDEAYIESSAVASTTIFITSESPNFNLNMKGGQVVSSGEDSIAINPESGGLYITGGKIVASGDRSIGVLCKTASLSLSKQAVLVCSGKGARGIRSNEGDLSIFGGSIVVESIDSIGIENLEGLTNITGGEILVSADKGKAVVAESGTIRLNGGTIRTEADLNIAIENTHGLISVASGTVNVNGSRSTALQTESGKISLTGGKINVEQADSYAISLRGHGAAAYLNGTVNGALYCKDENSGAIVEVQGFSPVSQDNDTDHGLSAKAWGDRIDDSCRYYWDLSGENPVIVFSYWKGSVVHKLDWQYLGSPNNQPGLNGQQVTDSNESQTAAVSSDALTLIAWLAVALLVLGGFVLIVRRRRVTKQPTRDE